VAGQTLALDRPPWDYQPIAIPFTNPPAPATIATATTDSRGCFVFTTDKDLGRPLTIRLIGEQPPDYFGFAITRLKDSQSVPPSVSYDNHLVHRPKPQS